MGGLQTRASGGDRANGGRGSAGSPSQTEARVSLLAAPFQAPGKPVMGGDSRVVSAIRPRVGDLHRRLRDRPEGLGGPETERAFAHRAGAARARRAGEMTALTLRASCQ